MIKKRKTPSSRLLAALCASIADSKLAGKIIVINLKKIETAPADFFVICSADSEVQIKAIAEEIQNECKAEGFSKPRIEGLEACQWVLLDLFDVVVHIMLPQTREFYNLERLWGDGQLMVLNDNGNLIIKK